MVKLLCYLFWMVALPGASYAEKLIDNPPLAADAKTKPTLFPEQIKAAQDDAARVNYSVMLGSHNFDTLEKEANKILMQYAAGAISSDDFILALYVMTPTHSGKLQINDLIAWTEAKPASYAAWYILGRQYNQIAMDARGGDYAENVAPEQFQEMDRYGRLSRDALLRSLSLYARPIATYRTLIVNDNYILKGQNTKNMLLEVACNATQILPKYFYEKFCLVSVDLTAENTQLGYLRSAIDIDPNATIPYIMYFNYNTPRWGGSFEKLYGLINSAEESKKIKPENIAVLKANLISHQAYDAWQFENNLNLAADLFVKAFDTSPKPENLNWLYTAASVAKKARNFDKTISICEKIINFRSEEYVAYFNRGALLIEEKIDEVRGVADQIASAKMGYMKAQNNVGYMYMVGEGGFPVNLQQAKEWLTLAANQGFQHSKDKLPVVEAKIADENSKNKNKNKNKNVD